MIRCIAVDDEPLALGLIKSYITRTPSLVLVETFSSALAALKYISENDIELAFLDIRMPELSGMELARILDQKQEGLKPKIVFTTAYDSYALEGYRVDALDYLLKPFNYVDFSRSAQKAMDYYKLIAGAQREYTDADHYLKEEPSARQDNFLYLKVDYQLIKTPKSDIVYIEGMKDYVKIYLRNAVKPLLTLMTLKSLEEKLDPAKFMRLHRSFIVSLNEVTSVTRNSVTIGQTNIPVSETYRDAFNTFLDRWKS